MENNGKRIIALSLLMVFFLAGCGETVRGVGKDFNRVGQGIRTIFVSE